VPVLPVVVPARCDEFATKMLARPSVGGNAVFATVQKSHSEGDIVDRLYDMVRYRNPLG